MGQLQGKASYLKATTSFINASERDVNKLWETFNDVAEGFGLNQDELLEICRSMQQTLEIHARSEMDQLSSALFTALDTDENGLVDALEFLGTMAMMSAMSVTQKLTFVYNCYDFNETGQLSLDELTLAFKSTLTGLYGGAKLLIATAGAEIFEIASSDGANLHFGPVPTVNYASLLSTLQREHSHCVKSPVELPVPSQLYGSLQMATTSLPLHEMKDVYSSGALSMRRAMLTLEVVKRMKCQPLPMMNEK
eukprot:jgi/Phyca11/16520/fgenesh1_pg.PHYCAscaffold_20_\